MAQARVAEPLPSPVTLPRLLVVTNDFPPRVGGVQRYVHDLVRHLPPERVAVLAPRWRGCREFDELQPFPVYRYGGTYLGPVPDVARRIRSLLRGTGAEMVLFGHALPLGALGPRLAADGVPYAALSHGVEVWMAALPGFRQLLRRAVSHAEVVFTVSRYTQRSLGLATPPGIHTATLPPGVDGDRFHPSVDGRRVRSRHRLGDRPVVVCVSRMIPRKGQDSLIRGWPDVCRRVPGAKLLLAGDGPYRSRLRALAEEKRVSDSIVFAGPVEEEDLPAHYSAANVFAMPCRSRRIGLEVEGFGIVYLEAAAAGKPVVAGDSGGAAEAVEQGETGLVVDGERPEQVADAVSTLLLDEVRAARMGAAGRLRVEREFTWPRVVGRFGAALAGSDGAARESSADLGARRLRRGPTIGG